MRRILFIAALSIFSWVISALAQVPLIVQERARIARSNEPVTLGAPFAKSELITGTPVRIVDPAGNPVDAQFKTMAVWDDGSIKWLKCDFQASVGANSTAQYTLETNAVHTPTTELTVTETSTAITITTGPLRFVVSKSNFNLFDQVWLDLNSDRQYTADEEIIAPGTSPGPVVSANGVDYLASAQAPEQIEVEEFGPMKVVIKVSGRHYNGANFLLKYETRIYAYAGQPFVKVWHVYANGQSVENLGNSSDPVFGAAFERCALDLQLNLTGSKTVRFGGDSGTEFAHSLPTAETAALVQADRNDVNVPLAYRIQQGATVLSSGSRAEGWGDISDGKWGLLLSSRYFWQKYPKGVVFRDDGRVSFEPAPTPEFLWIGMGTGDEILFFFHPASKAAQAQTQAMGLSKNPLFVRTTPRQYANSGAFYALLSAPSSLYPALDSFINAVTDNHLANRENLQLYGNINFGDVPRDQFGVTPFRDESSWGNNYYDATLTATKLFAQTGDLRYVDVFLPMAWHFMETACWNTYDPDDWMNGYCPSYSAYHRVTDHFEQHYGEGIWYYYYLTGDERAREVGLRAAQSIAFPQTWGNNNTACRMAYQRGSACLEAWKNTRDVTYLNLAKHLLVDKILATQDIFGLIGGSFEEGGFQVVPEQTFMMALYSDALWKYIQELSASDPARQQLIDKFALLADLFDTYARKSPGQEEYWNFWPIPNNSQSPQPERDPNNPDGTVFWNGKGLMAGTYAYAYDLTGEAKYKTLAMNLLADISAGGAFGEEFWGKASSQAMKNLLHAVAIVEGTPTSVYDPHEGSIPTAFELYQNYPNPFNPATTIRYSVAREQQVTLAVYDLLGREVVTLVDKRQVPGEYAVSFDAGGLASGVYFIRLQAGSEVLLRKMLLVR